jgi:hypothetical protein
VNLVRNVSLRGLWIALFLLAFAGHAVAGEAIFKSNVVGSNPGVVIAGVASGGAPWVVANGEAILHSDGKIKVETKGLILTNVGTAGPITHVSASLVCGGSGGLVVATTAAVPLSSGGDSLVMESITLPARCFGPVVLVRIAGVNGTLLANPGAWIAATGF